jgi:hypothetical protein
MSELATIPTPEEAFETLEALSRLRRSKVTVPKNDKFSRHDVVSSFASAFEMMGGTMRLALWANENPTEFYRLFGKLLPSATQAEVMHHQANGNVKHMTIAEIEEALANASANVIELYPTSEIDDELD